MAFSEFQHLTHLIGTSILVGLYLLRLFSLMRRRMAQDRSPDPKGEILKGVGQAFLTIVMPWKMESTRKHWTRYLEFVLFHLGVLANIAASFAVTYVPDLMVETVRAVLIALIGMGLVAGSVRFVRRLARPEMRVISSLDDYISIFLVLLFQLSGVLALLEIGWAFVAYFVLAAFFLVYEPFSKIRHYIYYPFARFFYGSEFGRKGILVREVRHD